MTYSARIGTFGVSDGWKVPLNPNGTPLNAPIPITGLTSVTGTSSQDVVNFLADEVVVAQAKSDVVMALTVSQYQWNHSANELTLHGLNYNSAGGYGLTAQPHAQPFMFYYVRQTTDGNEELVVWTYCTSSLVDNIGDATTTDANVALLAYSYVISAQTTPNTAEGAVLFWTSTDPTVIANAKAGLIPTPPSNQFIVGSSAIGGLDTIA